MSLSSGLEPQPGRGDHHEHREHPLERARGDQMREPGAGPRAEEEAEAEQEGSPEIQISVLMVGVGAEGEYRPPRT
jgi:hypothetical protein